jgi:hypothetical protein
MGLSLLFRINVLLFVLCTCAFAQGRKYPNELADYQFFENGKLKSLLLLTSSSRDVKHIFGEHCDKRCDYNADWSISFEYFENTWIKESSTDRGEKRTFTLDPKYLGKLRAIELKPKNRVSFLNISFPAVFERIIVTSTTDAREGKSRMTVNDAYQDPSGLTYEIYSRTNYDDINSRATRRYEKGDLVLIRYDVTKEMEKGLFVLQK